MTKITAITVRYGTQYPSEWVRRFLTGANRLVTAIELYSDLTLFWQKLLDHSGEGARHVDCTAPELLSLSIQQILGDTPGLPNAARNALAFFPGTPIYIPNPLSWCDQGGCN